MNDIVIRAEGLSKRYKIGEAQAPYRTLRETLMDAIRAPFQRLAAIARGENWRSAETTIWALEDVSFEVRRGEVLGVIGRNGAGKTTLLKVLSRITKPTEGYVDLIGRVGSLLEVGTGFHPELTGRENIFLNGAILGMHRAEIERKFDEIVGFAEIEKFLDTPVKRYSSGMYVRLAFAVAAHLEPEILLVDEVLAVGDAQFQKKCLGKMQDVAGEGRTVLFVSHNMGVIERLCNRVILLNEGRIAMQGPAPVVISEYLQSGMQQLGERSWENLSDAPGDDVARLHAVRALDSKGQVASEFRVTEEFCIEIEFWVQEEGHVLDATLLFYDEHGTMLFFVGDFQDKTWHNRPRPKGLHRSRCHVPANMLNHGLHIITTALATHPYTLRAIERNAITLQITDDMELGGARGSYTREWPSARVRPLFKWDLEFDHPRAG
jgi:lipopolysaccharide transport system ATP-binding protein